MKTFDVATRPVDWLTFALNVHQPDGDVLHEFRARDRLGAGDVRRIAGVQRLDADGRQVIDGYAALDYLRHVMPPEDWERLEKLIDDPTVVVDVDQFAEITAWVMEEQTGRPFTRQASSAPPPSNGGTSLTGVPSPPA